jgi:hypothetical protein
MKRFVRVRAVDGIAVPDPREPEYGPTHTGQRRFLGRTALDYDAVRKLAKSEGVMVRELSLCERFPISAEPVLIELDHSVKKLIARDELEQLGEPVAARTAQKAAALMGAAKQAGKLSQSNVGPKKADAAGGNS